jgi:hypothetical protein
MKNPRIQITFLLAFFLVQMLTHQIRAQAPPEERAAKLTEWMKTNLQLTDDQVAQVSGINLKYAQKNEALRNSTEARAAKFKKLKGYDADKEAELKKLFTDEQFKIYQTKKEEIKEEFKEKAKEKRKEQN